MSRRIWTPDCNGLADAGWKVATADGTVALTLCEAKRGRYLASRHSQAAAPTSDMPREIAKARLALRVSSCCGCLDRGCERGWRLDREPSGTLEPAWVAWQCRSVAFARSLR